MLIYVVPVERLLGMKTRASNFVGLFLLVLSLCTAWRVGAGPFQLISVVNLAPGAPAGGGGDSMLPIISPDGRYVLFSSAAHNLMLLSNNPVPVPLPPRLNVYLRDRINGTTTLVSVNTNGSGGGNGDSLPTGLSTNGQYALFESTASDLVAGDTNNASDVFLRNVVNGVTILISASTSGGIANGASGSSVLTPDGSLVAFTSAASNLVEGDTNGITDVFVRDWQADETTLVSVGAIATNFVPPLGGSDSPEIAPDGRYVAFYSTATNLVPGVKTIGGDVYVRDLVVGTTYWASVSARAEVLSALNSNNATSFNLALSTNGQYVAFEASPAYSRTGLILRYNLVTGLTDLVGTNATVPLVSAPEDARSLDMTPDGNTVAYVANTNDTSGATTCIIVWNAMAGVSALASGDLNGDVATNSTCDWPALDASGRFVAFLSSANNLVTNALVGAYHLYLRACLKMHLEFSETSQHEANHRQINDGFAGQGLAFVVPSESAGTPEPTERSLHYPAPWQHLEGMQVATLHDFDGATPQFACQPQQGAGIATVGPDMFDSAASLLTEEGRQQLLGAIAILDIGGQYSDQEQQAKGVDQDMSLASINLFSGVVAPLVAAFGALDTLAVDDGRTGLGLASFDHTHLLPQMGVNRHPQTGALPEPEIVVSGAPGSKVLWHIAPLTASLDDIEDCVEQLAEGVLAWPALLVGLGETIVDELPFAVSQIRCISHRKRITDCGTRYKLTLK